jgi:hypothetical protein
MHLSPADPECENWERRSWMTRRGRRRLSRSESGTDGAQVKLRYRTKRTKNPQKQKHINNKTKKQKKTGTKQSETDKGTDEKQTRLMSPRSLLP